MKINNHEISPRFIPGADIKSATLPCPPKPSRLRKRKRKGRSIETIKEERGRAGNPIDRRREERHQDMPRVSRRRLTKGSKLGCLPECIIQGLGDWQRRGQLNDRWRGKYVNR